MRVSGIICRGLNPGRGSGVAGRGGWDGVSDRPVCVAFKSGNELVEPSLLAFTYQRFYNLGADFFYVTDRADVAAFEDLDQVIAIHGADGFGDSIGL